MDGLLIVQSIVLVFRGVLAAIATSGSVEGTEYGMLITIAHLLSGFVVWCGIFGIWYFFFQVVPGHKNVWNDTDKAQNAISEA